MTDEQTPQSSSPELPAPDTTPVAPPVTPPKTPEKKPAKTVTRMSGFGRTVIAIALIIALAAAVGAGGLAYWMQMQRVQALEELTQIRNDLNDRTAQIIQLRNEMNQASEHLKQDRQAIQKAGAARDDLGTRMAALEKQIAVVTGSHRIDWMLKEIEHFIQLAERRVSLLGDARGALSLLQEADDIARDLNEPAARSLREALTKDIHALKLAAETSVDIDGIFLRLSQLVERIPRLNIPRYELVQDELVTTTSGAVPAEGLELFWHRFTDFMTSLVRYQKHEKQKPILLTSQRDYLAQSILLLLEQGQLALLRGDNNAYRLSLREARDRIDQFKQLQDRESRLFISELESLAAIQLQPAMPTLENSVRAVQVFRDFWGKEKIQREQAILKLEVQQAAEKARTGAQP